MAPAGRGCSCRGGLGARVPPPPLLPLLLLLLAALGYARATEHYSPLSLLKQELQHRQQQDTAAGGGCPQSGDWTDQYPAECGEWAASPRCGDALGLRGCGKREGGGREGEGGRRGGRRRVEEGQEKAGDEEGGGGGGARVTRGRGHFPREPAGCTSGVKVLSLEFYLGEGRAGP